jgi:hypothetical protein
MSAKCQEETWPSEGARYWGYKEAQLRRAMQSQSPVNCWQFGFDPTKQTTFRAKLCIAEQGQATMPRTLLGEVVVVGGESAPRSGVVAFCRCHCRIFRELQDARASIALARFDHVRRGRD